MKYTYQEQKDLIYIDIHNITLFKDDVDPRLNKYIINTVMNYGLSTYLAFLKNTTYEEQLTILGGESLRRNENLKYIKGQNLKIQIKTLPYVSSLFKYYELSEELIHEYLKFVIPNTSSQMGHEDYINYLTTDRIIRIMIECERKEPLDRYIKPIMSEVSSMENMNMDMVYLIMMKYPLVYGNLPDRSIVPEDILFEFIKKHPSMIRHVPVINMKFLSFFTFIPGSCRPITGFSDEVIHFFSQNIPEAIAMYATEMYIYCKEIPEKYKNVYHKNIDISKVYKLLSDEEFKMFIDSGNMKYKFDSLSEEHINYILDNCSSYVSIGDTMNFTEEHCLKLLKKGYENVLNVRNYSGKYGKVRDFLVETTSKYCLYIPDLTVVQYCSVVDSMYGCNGLYELLGPCDTWRAVAFCKVYGGMGWEYRTDKLTRSAANDEVYLFLKILEKEPIISYKKYKKEVDKYLVPYYPGEGKRVIGYYPVNTVKIDFMKYFSDTDIRLS